MHARWKTLTEIAADRHISLAQAQSLVEREHCPVVFRQSGAVYLI
jgi:hypothetical protein